MLWSVSVEVVVEACEVGANEGLLAWGFLVVGLVMEERFGFVGGLADIVQERERVCV